MINAVTLVGRMTRDPELRYSAAGVAVCSFTLAVNKAFKKDEADFPNVVCFKKTAENTANYTKKGSLVGIEGRLQTRSYENKEGKKVFVTEVIANQVAFLDSKSQVSSEQPTKNKTEPNFEDPFGSDGKPIDIDDSDLPF